MDKIAQRYGKRPSELAGIDSDPVLAFQFDAAIMLRGVMEENEQYEKSKAGSLHGSGNSGNLPAEVLARVNAARAKEYGRTVAGNSIGFGLN